MASSINPLSGQSTSSTSGSGSSSSGLGASAPSEGVFLQLLVSQLQNQDPLNPADSTTFVTQLAQFSELEQVIGIRGDIESVISPSSTTAASQASGSDTSQGQTTTRQNANTQNTGATAQL